MPSSVAGPIAWFSPFPPARSGIAAYSDELLPRLAESFVIEPYPESAAHDFVWRHRLNPYALVVYQLGNAPCHDYMWAYMARYPGLVVLHDARLHHARALHLLQQRRFDDYRMEFRHDHPGVNPDAAEFAVQGLGGTVSYFWPMLRAVMQSARAVAVHNPRVALDLRQEYAGVTIETIRMGVAETSAAAGARARIRHALGLNDDACVFAAFGKVTAEKRIGAILKALGTLVAHGQNAHLLLVGAVDGYPALDDEVARHGVRNRVHVAGHVDDHAIADYLAAADACLCLRWPTAQESSASWLRCLAAARPTVISDLAHLVDVPDDVALRVDLIDEDRSLLAALQRLVADRGLREALASTGHAYWATHHTLDAMAADYRAALVRAAALPAPQPTNLPRHFTEDRAGLAWSILERFGQPTDWLA
jgi:glycosyltransferase involved in cell wall biosynthesis